MLGNAPDNGVKVNTKDSTTIPVVSGGRVEDEAATSVEEMTAMLALKVLPFAKEEAPPPSKAVKIPGNESCKTWETTWATAQVHPLVNLALTLPPIMYECWK